MTLDKSQATWKKLLRKLKKDYNLPDEVVHVMSINNRLDYHPNPDIIHPSTILQDRAHLVDKRNKQTMSAPHIHATALKYMYETFLEYSKKKNFLDPRSKFNVLDVGCGTGYVLACMVYLSKLEYNKSIAVGIDIYKSLTNLTQKNINEKAIFESDNPKEEILKKIIVKCGNGWEGYIPPESTTGFKYHFIHVGAMADEIPVTLINLLDNNGGVMIIPINGEYQIIKKKRDKKI